MARPRPEVAVKKSILEMNEEEWIQHYSKVLDQKTERCHCSASELATCSHCWIFSGRSDRDGYGRIDVIIPRVGKKVLFAHRLRLMVNMKTLQLPSNIETSHICGERFCVRADHLSGEGKNINKGRQICHGLGQCSGHSPQCIFPR